MMNKNDYFVFDGDWARTGKPNRRTGLYDTYGSLRCFRTKEEALKYVEQERVGKIGRYILKVGKRSTMRQYCLGMTVRDFNEMLDHMYYWIV